MALMRCPECGLEVSDKASSCPKCGYPIKEIGKPVEVKIHIKFKAGDFIGLFLKGNVFSIYNTQTKKELWKGTTGRTVCLNIETETELGISWGKATEENSNCYNVGRITVNKGENYVIENGLGFHEKVPIIKKVDSII